MLATTICQPSNETPHSVVTYLIFTCIPNHCNPRLHVLITYKDAFPIGVEDFHRIGKTYFTTRWHCQRSFTNRKHVKVNLRWKLLWELLIWLFCWQRITLFSMPIGLIFWKYTQLGPKLHEDVTQMVCLNTKSSPMIVDAFTFGSYTLNLWWVWTNLATSQDIFAKLHQLFHLTCCGSCFRCLGL